MIHFLLGAPLLAYFQGVNLMLVSKGLETHCDRAASKVDTGIFDPFPMACMEMVYLPIHKCLILIVNYNMLNIPVPWIRHGFLILLFFLEHTLPESKIAPGNRPIPKRTFHFPTIDFQGLC